ncbi:MAG: carbamoyltransferase HypF, partial [Geminicoccaceae bacterium]|nr:carbamoyltransferase HypF [Geminicoccaceae bacterium]
MIGKAELQGVRIRVAGIVQGVGFRPFVHRLATGHGLDGRVWNDPGGVVIEVAGERGAIDAFLGGLRQGAPPAASVETMRVEPAPELALDPPRGFRIIASRSRGAHTLGVGPDLAMCAACRSEIFEWRARRYRYPFTNCTECGPRLSILEGTPYDRAETTMRAFRMCARCEREYHDPTDRRFHAEPNACPACGPQARFERVGDGDALTGWSSIRHSFWQVIGSGGSVAVKGIGGYHLACLAADEAAVRRLRERKRRPDKPLAVMAASLEVLHRHCILSPKEAEALASPAAPILLLWPRGGQGFAPSVAPRQHRIGAMLPYTPLHHLLFEGRDEVLVMTSGNLADRPQITDDDEAKSAFKGVADAILTHDRRIAVRADDSVGRFDGRTPTWLRLGRGLAPLRLAVPKGLERGFDCIALGAQLKATFCLKQGDRLVLGQHIGDLDHVENRDALAGSVRHVLRLHGLRPERIALDLHPEVGSAGLAEELASETGAALVRVQHHHAHAVACLAEHGHPLDGGPALAVVMDGLGYGPDKTIWGFEFLSVDYTAFRRLAHLRPVPMPGGEAAVR